MQSKPETPDRYIEQLPPERKLPISTLRKEILSNLPSGFKETMGYGMIGYVVPHSLYPKGYHVNPKLPLPFMNLASQKNHIAVYHMGVYSIPALMDWFVKEYPDHCKTKLDMGKSCIRFKNPGQIPFKLIGELSSKISVKEWIETYESLIDIRSR